MGGGKKMELTCYVDAIDVSIGELLDCILGTTGEEAVILKVEAHHCIVQEVRNLACHLKRERERERDQMKTDEEDTSHGSTMFHCL